MVTNQLEQLFAVSYGMFKKARRPTHLGEDVETTRTSSF
jgi:hypothetical protein